MLLLMTILCLRRAQSNIIQVLLNLQLHYTREHVPFMVHERNFSNFFKIFLAIVCARLINGNLC